MKHHSGSFYVDLAEKNNMKIVHGKGDHVKVSGPAGRGYETIPLHKELKTGTECHIRSWFRAVGILLSLICGLAYIVFMA